MYLRGGLFLQPREIAGEDVASVAEKASQSQAADFHNCRLLTDTVIDRSTISVASLDFKGYQPGKMEAWRDDVTVTELEREIAAMSRQVCELIEALRRLRQSLRRE